MFVWNECERCGFKGAIAFQAEVDVLLEDGYCENCRGWCCVHVKASDSDPVEVAPDDTPQPPY